MHHHSSFNHSIKESLKNELKLFNTIRFKDQKMLRSLNPILTEEERAVLIQVAIHPGSKHLTNKEIGRQLGFSENKVKSLLHQACLKLDASNRNEAVLLALKRREISLNELLTLNELADLLCSLDPEEIREIADYVRNNRIQRAFPIQEEQIISIVRSQQGILTNREKDVLILASYGLTNTEIAERLFMTPDAVRTFMNRSFKKLGATKRADAIQLALKKREISVCERSSREELIGFLAPLGSEAIDKLAEILEKKQK